MCFKDKNWSTVADLVMFIKIWIYVEIDSLPFISYKFTVILAKFQSVYPIILYLIFCW